MTFPLPQKTLFYQLEKSIKLYRKMAQERIDASGHSVSVNQLILLLNLSEHPDASQVELAEHLLKDFASVARMVDILVRKKLLERTENTVDRRKKDLRPTPACLKMIGELKPVIEGYRQESLANFSASQLDQMHQLLDQFIDNCERGVGK
ncbi:MAG: MarR family winged helix-turn-helix transcriptional regulator [Lysobacterales bacterium]